MATVPHVEPPEFVALEFESADELLQAMELYMDVQPEAEIRSPNKVTLAVPNGHFGALKNALLQGGYSFKLVPVASISTLPPAEAAQLRRPTRKRKSVGEKRAMIRKLRQT